MVENPRDIGTLVGVTFGDPSFIVIPRDYSVAEVSNEFSPVNVVVVENYIEPTSGAAN